MSNRSIEQIVLELVVEDSYALSELVSRIRQEHAELSEREARRLARDSVKEMLSDGLVEITRLETPGGPESVVDHNAARLELDDDLSWMTAKHWRVHVRVVASAAGRERYFDPRQRT